LAALKAAHQADYTLLRQAIAHLILGLGGEDEADTRIAHRGLRARNGEITDASWSRPSPRSCSPKPSTTRTCKPMDGRWPTA
jgi:hypothetical protein